MVRLSEFIQAKKYSAESGVQVGQLSAGRDGERVDASVRKILYAI